MLRYAFYNCLRFYIESDSVSLGVSWFLLAILYNYYKYKDITLAVLETLEYYYFSIFINIWLLLDIGRYSLIFIFNFQ